MYNNQKAYIAELGHIGGMINGSAFDQVLKFVHVEDSYDVTTATNAPHDLNTQYTSGNTTIAPNDNSKNVYDLEGNLREFTAELFTDREREKRGGCYGSSARRPAVSRYARFH